MTNWRYRDDDDKCISKPIPLILDAKHLTSLTAFWVFLKNNESDALFSAVYAEFRAQNAESMAHAIQIYLAIKSKFERLDDEFNNKWGGNDGE